MTIFNSLKSLFFVLLLCFTVGVINAQNFNQSNLNFNGNGFISKATSLMFGPDGKLYVSEYSGKIKIFTIERTGIGNYNVINQEILSDIQAIVNHNDDGSLFLDTNRETTGLTLAGTSQNPIIYVTSSDYRIGGGGGGSDIGLDTNSGIITRFLWTGSLWEVVDLVRGLPRSEENHATNGLEFVSVNGIDYLIVTQGGHTNGGSPSNNFAKTSEYVLSASILSINLSQLEAMPIKSDNGRNYVYDLPTLDDPSRANSNGITDPDMLGYDGVDVNDPFGGNDGLNQAILVPNGPVQIFSPGYRNAYDLVVTENGSVYVTDNGANGGWGGFPENEGGGSVTNNYLSSEPGSSTSSGNEKINNEDHLTLITSNIQNYVFGSFYGGHPNPTRANPQGAGLFIDDGVISGFRTMTYDPDGSTPNSTTDINQSLPANWPPTFISNSIEGDWRGPGINNPDGPDDQLVTLWGTNTNGIDEYTASNFSGAMKGNLLAGKNDGTLHRVELKVDGSLETLTSSFASGLGGNVLGVSCNGDDDPFPGSVWLGTFNNNIVILEPQDFVPCILPGEIGYTANADNDQDGYTNQDEIDNGTDFCGGGSAPNDFDKITSVILVSDLNDTDDDNDGILDADDPLQLGSLNGGSDSFVIPVINELFSDTELGGYLGLGLTGLMNNGDANPNWLNWLDRRDDVNDPNPNDILGGAIGAMTMQMTSGTAKGVVNNQEKGFQYGVQVNEDSEIFIVSGSLLNFNAPLQLYGNANAPNGELGLFIGDGTQNNFIQFVITKTGLSAQQEIDNVLQAPIEVVLLENETPSDNLSLSFVVNPSNGVVALNYSIDGGQKKTLGEIQAQGLILEAIQDFDKDLIVGLIGSSGASGVELEGTWDYLNVSGSAPYVVNVMQDIVKQVNAVTDTFNLNEYFGDVAGIENLTYTVTANSDTNISVIINNEQLVLTYPAIEALSSVTIRATDADSLFVEQTFTVAVNNEAVVLYRVNAGGPEISAIDGGILWEADEVENNSPYLSNPGANRTGAFEITSYVPEIDLLTTPIGIFGTERFDSASGNPNMTYSFPVVEEGIYEVRLYMGNGYSGTSNPDSRIFNVEIEGLALGDFTNIDLSGNFGHQVGAVILNAFEVTDGTLDIVFLHGAIENPLINGIEILKVSSNIGTPVVVNSIPNQANNLGDVLASNLKIIASGGQGNLSYQADNLPPGIILDQNTGVFGGIVSATSDTTNPYQVVVSVNDENSDTLAQQISFDWNINRVSVLYRINAGGPEVSAIDGNISWAQDNTTLNSEYLQNAGTNSVGASAINSYTNNIDLETTVLDIFNTERYDLTSGAPNMSYSFPVSENGAYQVRLYMGDSYTNSSEVGERVFDVEIEGQIIPELDNIDLSGTYGHKVGAVISYDLFVEDGFIDIVFIHGVIQNPLVNGIEILLVPENENPIVVSSFEDQVNTVDEVLDGSLQVIASGGDGNLVFSATGLPPGVSIEPTNGQIGGKIDSGADVNNPYNVSVEIDDQDGIVTDKQVLNFTWTINPNTSLTTFTLVDAANDGDVMELTHEAQLPITLVEGKFLNIRANSTSAIVNSIVFDILGPINYSSADNIAPFTLLGDTDGSYNGGSFYAGDYTLETKEYTGVDGTGTLIRTTIIQFSIVNEDSNDDLTFTLIDAANDGEVFGIIDGMVINNDEVEGKFLNIRANTQVDVNGSVQFNLTGAANQTFIDNIVPYALYGDTNGSYAGHGFPVGNYTLTTTKFSEPDAGGEVVISETIQFSISADGNQSPVASAVADVLTGTVPLTVNFDALDSTDDTAIVGYSWDFEDGNTTDTALASNTFTEAGVYNVSLVVEDEGGLTATDQLTITVLPAAQGSISFTMMDAANDGELVALIDGQVLNINEVQNKFLNIRANSGETVGSIQLNISGPVNHTFVDNVIPYALFGDDNGSYNGNIFPEGNYTVTAIAYSGTDGSGTASSSTTITFSISEDGNQTPFALASADQLTGAAPLTVNFNATGSTDDTAIVAYHWDFGDGNTANTALASNTFSVIGVYTVLLTVEDGAGLQATDELVITVSPANQGDISFTMMNAADDGEYITLLDGQIIDFNEVQNQFLNIRANTNVGVGSVRFNLAGPINHTQVDNIEPYSIFGDTAGSYNGFLFSAGDYVLTATNYSGEDAGGEASNTTTINFTIVNPSGLKSSVTKSSVQNLNIDSDSELVYFPNPAIDEIWIANLDSETEIKDVVLFRANGQRVYSFVARKHMTFTKGLYMFNVAHLAQGFYVAHIITVDGELKIMKIIKE